MTSSDAASMRRRVQKWPSFESALLDDEEEEERDASRLRSTAESRRGRFSADAESV